MFEFVRKHTRILQFILVLLIFPSFVIFGIQGYSRFGEGAHSSVATVAGQPVTQAEWEAAHRQYVERLRRQMPNVEARLLDTPAVKQQVLDQLVRERVLRHAAEDSHLVTSDTRLQRLFATDPQFAGLRNADGSINSDLLALQGMSSEMFVARLRQDLSAMQVLQGVAATEIATDAVAKPAVDAMFQQRLVQVEKFDAKSNAAKVSPTDAEIDAYYKNPAHAAQFQAPEQADIEYVVLDVDALKKQVSVTEEDLRKYYAENEARYTTPAERRASHILVKADKSAKPAERAAAKAKAEALLAEVKKKPSAFAELARKNSDDPGSAAKGGDLDFFGKGAMVKPFEDSVFSMKQGEISNLVESDFGFHIIEVTGIRGGDKRSFEAVRAELEDEVRQQLAQKRFSEAAVEFTNTVYEQSDSLKPTADKLKLEVRRADGVSRVAAPTATGPLASTKLLEALFNADTLRNKRNTDAVETGPSQLASARVLAYRPAHQRALDEVKALVREKLVAEQAAALAKKDGEARLAALKAAPGTTSNVPELAVSRADPKGVAQPVLDAALKADAAKLPAVVGVELPGEGYAVLRVLKVMGRDPALADAAGVRQQYTKTWADAEALAYYNALKSRFKVSVKADFAASAPAP